jgi:hypothetical protein
MPFVKQEALKSPQMGGSCWVEKEPAQGVILGAEEKARKNETSERCCWRGKYRQLGKNLNGVRDNVVVQHQRGRQW